MKRLEVCILQYGRYVRSKIWRSQRAWRRTKRGKKQKDYMV